MDTKALRQKILDLAIRGKLVPQDPNDEPASVLLERIRAEKQQMVKDGKLKAKDIKNDTIIYKGDDNLHYEKFPDGSVKCIEDEIPFELPQGWSWERLGNISNIARGGSPRPIESYITDDSNGINWIKIGDTEKDGKYIFKTKEKIKPEGLSKSRYVEAGDFLLTNSMSFGRPYILKTNGCIHDGWLVIGNIRTVFNADFLYFALSSNFMYQTLSLLAAGSTVKNLKSDTVKSVLFPIPPIQEQERIATKLDELISFVNTIETDKTTLQDLIKQTKSKILDLAIRGKLVPQDPNDEPASVLIERIRAEKEELIRQGKIKRDKKESVIFKGEDNSYYETIGNNTINIDDEIPFELPEGWGWCRFLSVTINRDAERKPISSTKRNGIAKVYDYYGASGIIDKIDNFIFSEKLLLIGEDGANLVTRSKPIAFFANGKYWVNNHAHCIDSLKKEYLDYLCIYINAIDLSKYITGSAQPKMTQDNLNSILIPFPPCAEQIRIVKAIETAFAQLDEISNSIT